MTSMWDYNESMSDTASNLVGFDVEATDGGIGKIDESSDQAGAAFLVVDTGFWIFGKKRMIPAGVVQRVDAHEHKVYVTLTKDDIKSAPDFKDQDRDSRESHDTYYGPLNR